MCVWLVVCLVVYSLWGVRRCTWRPASTPAKIMITNDKYDMNKKNRNTNNKNCSLTKKKVRVAPGIDAGLVLCGLLAVDKLEAVKL